MEIEEMLELMDENLTFGVWFLSKRLVNVLQTVDAHPHPHFCTTHFNLNYN